ncbi:putative DNA-directed RNA polymerase III subunit rpc6 [Glarea lozoyensis 74030]|uniref:DNA-directed RNA polymerase III subunit RPC6 n=1 Tax=Glarea lozoyensis (strain ATCC 74030 / MF5533) TaxID=1104152 RepID=H0EX48_GLAL7|nr:putative DNA-directed RNA polymerase III subunit rpc6 [Glarea lozoyensis 74030]
MASSSTAMDLDEPSKEASKTPGLGGKNEVDPVLEVLNDAKRRVYQQCWDEVTHGEGNRQTVFYQTDILDLGIIPDNNIETLLMVTQALLDEKLFKAVHSSEGLGFRVRSEDEAKVFRGLSADQELVYGLIDESEAEGIWHKTIKARLNLHETALTLCLKQLQQKGLVGEMKSVQNPSRKMWIKAHLRPSERATGGSWYTDGELDEVFIQQICDLLYAHIKQKSFYFSSSAYKKSSKGGKKPSLKEASAARDKVLASKGLDKPEIDDERSSRSRKYDAYFPMPADYNGYPNVDELTGFIHNIGITSQLLVSSEIQQLLDIMCFDGKIERVVMGSYEGKEASIGYKATRRTLRDEHELGSVLTEAPCGRCPVFDICDEGGPVNPKELFRFKMKYN